jgi:hypothetical protein
MLERPASIVVFHAPVPYRGARLLLPAAALGAGRGLPGLVTKRNALAQPHEMTRSRGGPITPVLLSSTVR